jgi:hypothetical protein
MKDAKYIGKYENGLGIKYYFDENMMELGYTVYDGGKFIDHTRGRKWSKEAMEKLIITKTN